MKTKKLKKNHVLVEYDPGDGEVGVYELAVTRNERNNQVLKMWRSNDRGWSKAVRGAPCMEIYDDGDGVLVESSDEAESVRYNYSEIEHLLIALEYYHKYSGLDPWKPRERWWSKKAYKNWKKKSLQRG